MNTPTSTVKNNPKKENADTSLCGLHPAINAKTMTNAAEARNTLVFMVQDLVAVHKEITQALFA